MDDAAPERSPAVRMATRCMSLADSSVIVTPRGYIRAIGDKDAADLLAQVQYLQQQRGAWFAYSAADWEEDLLISKHTLKKCIEKLRPFGLQVRQIPTHPSVTTHWYIDEAILERALQAYSQQVKIHPLDAAQHSPQIAAQNTENHHDTTGENLPVNGEKIDCQQAKIYPLTGENLPVNRRKFTRSTKRLIETTKTTESTEIKGDIRETAPPTADADPLIAPLVEKEEIVVTEQDPAYRVALALRTAIAQYTPNPDVLPRASPKGLAPWIAPITTLLKKYKATDIRLVVDWLPHGAEYWQSRLMEHRRNVTPASQLCKHFDAIFIQANKKGTAHGTAHKPQPEKTIMDSQAERKQRYAARQTTDNPTRSS